VKALRLLLVEDNPVDAMLALKAMPAAWVSVATIDDALTALAERRFDAVVCDLCLGPYRDAQVVEQVRRAAVDVPLLVLSGMVTDDLVADLVEAGADAVLSKDNYELLTRGVAVALAQRQRYHRATLVDELTGLPNGKALRANFREAYLRAARRNERVALLYFDLDDFKSINDQHGHSVGDNVIRLVAEKARLVLRELDVLGRLHGDEFVVIAEGVSNVVDAVALGKRLLHGISRTVKLGDAELSVSVSVGCALYPDHGEHFDELCKAADQAMLAAKRAGRAQVRVAG